MDLRNFSNLKSPKNKIKLLYKKKLKFHIFGALLIRHFCFFCLHKVQAFDKGITDNLSNILTKRSQPL